MSTVWTDSNGTKFVLLAVEKHHFLGIRIDEGLAPISDVMYMNVQFRTPPNCFESKWEPTTQTLTILVNPDMKLSSVDYHSPFALTYIDGSESTKPEQLQRPLAQELIQYIFELYSECAGIIDCIVDREGLYAHIVYKIPKTRQALIFKIANTNTKQPSSFCIPSSWFQRLPPSKNQSTEFLFVIANSVRPVIDLSVAQRKWRCPSEIVCIKTEYLSAVRDLVQANLYLFNTTCEDDGLVLGYDPSLECY